MLRDDFHDGRFQCNSICRTVKDNKEEVEKPANEKFQVFSVLSGYIKIHNKKSHGMNCVRAQAKRKNVLVKETRFRCDVCDLCCASKQSLNRHKTSHDTYKMYYKCELCNRIFNRKDNLKIHDGREHVSKV